MTQEAMLDMMPEIVNKSIDYSTLSYVQWKSLVESEGYVMAADEDFYKEQATIEDVELTIFKYKGDGEFIIIPDTIQGVPIVHHISMFERFSGGNLKGVASYNPEVFASVYMFSESRLKSLDLKYYNLGGNLTMNSMFSLTTIGELDMRHIDTSRVLDTNNLFVGAQINRLIGANFNMMNNKDMRYMFSISSISIEDINLENIPKDTNYIGAFYKSRVDPTLLRNSKMVPDFINIALLYHTHRNDVEWLKALEQHRAKMYPSTINIVSDTPLKRMGYDTKSKKPEVAIKVTVDNTEVDPESKVQTFDISNDVKQKEDDNTVKESNDTITPKTNILDLAFVGLICVLMSVVPTIILTNGLEYIWRTDLTMWKIFVPTIGVVFVWFVRMAIRDRKEGI